MRRAAPFLLLMTLVLAAAAPLRAQDFAGSWEMTRDTPRGTMTQTLTLARDGDAWTGTMTFMRREIELKEVKVEGNVLTFTLEMGPPPDAPGGRGPMIQTFRGTLEGDEINGEMEGPRGPMPMVLKRKQG
ncbi:MAG TPA: hypothetical protein VLA43_00475 [Longimicrobiales bacterium]|nr:hypothetical protein [Longimicrobiales bacterium]